MKFLKVCFHNKDKGLNLKIGGIIFAANPEVCSHNEVIKDGCGSVQWTEMAQGSPVIGSSEYNYIYIYIYTHTYSWTISLFIILRNV
jgi:hypothetical protein